MIVPEARQSLPDFGPAFNSRGNQSGQVAQLVERSPEKAGVGGSIPSLATIIPKKLASFVTNPSSQHLVSN